MHPAAWIVSRRRELGSVGAGTFLRPGAVNRVYRLGSVTPYPLCVAGGSLRAAVDKAYADQSADAQPQVDEAA
ncbi:hypothetical protein Slala05_26280 [Streptomyces lavendulae subsp. lavendulae]|nr:hypothetical protein Slala05_26280 [Streptomyces lavendulae subsp. lavendulae]